LLLLLTDAVPPCHVPFDGVVLESIHTLFIYYT
jgi:hypothetical protein